MGSSQKFFTWLFLFGKLDDENPECLIPPVGGNMDQLSNADRRIGAVGFGSRC